MILTTLPKLSLGKLFIAQGKRLDEVEGWTSWDA